ncbi:hypothetical protein K9L16_04170 [Candidatus Pacearchaeota archaeon]|nr:hypothetical protein [Candidatus Pacearchaeota archaeon]
MDPMFKDLNQTINNFENELKFRKEENSLEKQLAETKFRTKQETISYFEKHLDYIKQKFNLLLVEQPDIKKENSEEE